MQLRRREREDKLKTDVKDVRVAIIYEDGPYGAGVAQGNEAMCKQLGMNVVLKEGYAATAPDLSSLVTKLRRAAPTCSCTPATTPTSRCSCARRASRG